MLYISDTSMKKKKDVIQMAAQVVPDFTPPSENK